MCNPALDQYNLANDYGVQSANRTHIFNAAYSIELGNPINNNKIAGGFVNGWQLSGITQIESGPNLTGIQGQNFGMNLNGYKIPGSISAQNPTGINISNVSLLGTNDIQLNPILTCNPASGLAANQYINPSCFAIPTAIGQNGPSVLPAIYGPAFFNSDLGLFKNFQIKESKKLQIRFNGTNFLNHPLWSFNGANLDSGFRWHFRQGQHAIVRHRHRKAGPSHRPSWRSSSTSDRWGCNLIHRADVSREASALSFCRGLT